MPDALFRAGHAVAKTVAEIDEPLMCLVFSNHVALDRPDMLQILPENYEKLLDMDLGDSRVRPLDCIALAILFPCLWHHENYRSQTRTLSIIPGPRARRALQLD